MFQFSKFSLLVWLSLLLLSMCSSEKQKFSIDQWAYSNDDGFPHRKKMVEDLIENHLDVCGHQIKELLGEPVIIHTEKNKKDRIFYFIETKKSIHIDPYYSSYLELKIDKDSCVIESKIVEH